MVIGLLAIDDTPHLNPRVNLSPAQIAKVKRLLERNDPRHLRTGSLAKARLGQEELDLALNYAANQYAGGASQLIIGQGKASVLATLPLPWFPPGGFLNFQIELIQTNTLPKISAFSVGHLTVPAFIANNLVSFTLSMLPFEIDWQEIGRMLKTVRFANRQVLASYTWQGNLPAQLGGALLSSRERELLWIYQARLAELSRSTKRNIALTALLNGLFHLAEQRSKLTDAAKENRAALRVLGFYVTQKDLGQLMPANKRWPRPIWRRVLLQGREDFSKHYLLSALLAADAGSPLANAVGLYKEIQDSRGGSGFSFNDLAADRAGTLMGERAIGGHTAVAVQQLLAVAAQSDIMPETADLPEFMPEAEFNRRYGGIEGTAYRDMMLEIERRIAALTISRQQSP